MYTEMIINNEGDYSFIDSYGYESFITIGQAINILAKWEEEGKTVKNIIEYNVEKWWAI